MIDRYVLDFQHASLRPFATRLVSLGISADALTVIGFAFGVVSAGLVTKGAVGWALLAFLLSRLLDGLDGAVARLVGPSDRGAFMDIALDFAIYALIPLSFAVADPALNALAASLLLAAFMGTSSSFLAFAAIAAKRGVASVSFPHKGIYYLGGLTEGAETIVAFTAMYVWPVHFPVIATIFAGLALLTTLMRWWWGWRIFSEPVS